MKIAILSTYKLNYAGGGEKWIIEISRALVRLGHQVHVYAPEDKSIPDFVAKGIYEITYKSHLYSLGKKLKIYNLIYPFLRPKIIGEYNVTYSTSFYFFFPVITSKNTFIIGTHDFYVSKSKISIDSFRKIWILILKLILKRKNVYIHSINKYITSQLKTIKSRVKEIPTFPYHFCEEPNISDNLRILFLGRVEYRKGAKLLLNFAKALTHTDKVELNIIGRIDRKYENIVEKLKNKENVRFLGFLTDIEVVNYLNNSDLILFFSSREAFSLTVLEALYNGLPIVSTYNPLIYLLDEKYIKIAEENVSDVIKQVGFFKELLYKDKEEYLRIKKDILKRNRNIYNRERIIDETVKLFK